MAGSRAKPAITYPIDLVYLWVDGNDQKWRAKKNSALAAAGRAVPRHVAVNSRQTENDELKYSLRSVEKFAPWVNRIFIITDKQKPAWLNTKNPKITIVDHAEFMPKKLLPTFNSNMIELFLHKIPDLAEHFLYANDDMFFGRPVSPDFFFDSRGNPIVIMGKKNWPDSYYLRGAAAAAGRGVYYQSDANALKYVYDKTGIKSKFRYKHAIEPARKSWRAKIFDSDARHFVRTTATPFRTKEKIRRTIFPLMDNALGRNTIVQRGNINMNRVALHLRNMPETFCVNGTWLLNSFRSNLRAMKKLLPEKSGFEK